MSLFLFGKKKQSGNATPQATSPSGGSNVSVPAVNGARDKEKEVLSQQGGGNTPSPEQGPGTRRPSDSDEKVSEAFSFSADWQSIHPLVQWSSRAHCCDRSPELRGISMVSVLH